ncbi:MAG: helix-turn-helix domain-containing protein [Thermomicrobium sp.]|nr:helix-turn-helix domain-containing protein [Thermomicrobium sp.]MDW8005842.1 helix-turn-helix domain-containing protein [Thermomicrobium sp.]
MTRAASPLGTAELALGALLAQLARLVAAELRADVQAELRRLAAVQVVGDEWTCSVSEAARLLGIDRNTAYAEIHRTGCLAGVPVLRVGERYRVSKLAIAMRLMGTEHQTSDATTGLVRRKED